ncbi:hypothetical protein NESM_000605300 [Novymonas esmeraldas]|uniref:Uncharacterized protein n=1 Tax=Novymonas esmeraldas TaxID=1808958 RepID=A0AAW0EU89_9TRYP
MFKGVITGAEILSRLLAILRQHPNADALRLQLTPPTAVTCPLMQRVSVASAADTVVLYAVLSRGDATGSAAEEVVSGGGGGLDIVAVYAVVEHSTSLTLAWCEELQRSLSVASLLATPTRSIAGGGGGVHEAVAAAVNTDCGRGCAGGVASFTVQLSPYVPPLQWRRAVDGVFGSHHCVCGSYVCDVHHADDTGAAHAPTEATPLPAATSSTPAPSRRRARLETAAATALCASPGSAAKALLPLRVAAVLHAHVPMSGGASGRSTAPPGVRVLLLSAVDGALLTGGAASTTRELHHSMCSFLSREVVPRVSLRPVGATWASAAGSAHVWDDVCGVWERLGTSYVMQFAAATGTSVSTAASARGVVVVVDLSPPLVQTLSPLLTPDPPPTASDCATKQLQRVAAQVAAAVQDALTHLVRQHPDAFSTRDGSAAGADMAARAAAPPRGAPAHHHTPEMYCQSIAASVSRIVAVSPHTAFVDEVVRLLWSSTSDADTDSTASAAPVTRRLPAAIQQRVEERLLRAIAPPPCSQ